MKSATGSSVTTLHFTMLCKLFLQWLSMEKVQMLFTAGGEKPPKAQTIKLENTGCNPPVLQNLPFWKWENNTEIWAIECV